MRALLILLSSPQAMSRFRDGIICSGWLKNVDQLLQRRRGLLLAGFDSSSGGERISSSNTREVNFDACHLPGFAVLQQLLPQHAHVPELYFLLMAMMLGHQVKQLPTNVQFDLDSVWNFMFGDTNSPHSPTKKISGELCPEAASILLAMIRTMLNKPCHQQTGEEENQAEDVDAWIREYPMTLMQFFQFLFHNHHEFQPLSLSPEFLVSLAATLFPYRGVQSQPGSEIATPEDEFKAFEDNQDTMVLIRQRPTGTTGTLCAHPARKFVLDFLKVIILESFALPMSSRGLPVIDIVLEAAPEHATVTQQKEFHTELMTSLMNHITAADLLLGEQSALPLPSGGSYAALNNNVLYFAARVVDKLWQEQFLGPPKDIVYFIRKLIAQARRLKRSAGCQEAAHRSLNRVLLYQLSRPCVTPLEQAHILEALHAMSNQRQVIFSQHNTDTDFFACLAITLLRLVGGDEGSGDVSEDGDVRHTGHSRFYTAETGRASAGVEGKRMIRQAVRRLWEELYMSKKNILEDILKTQLNPSGQLKHPDLPDLRGLIEEHCGKVWSSYLEQESCGGGFGMNMRAALQGDKFSIQLQQKLTRVGSGVLRLASGGAAAVGSASGRRQRARESASMSSGAGSATDSVTGGSNLASQAMTCQEAWPWVPVHVALVRDLVELKWVQWQHTERCSRLYLEDEWQAMEEELTRERGLWGPEEGSALGKWMLDPTEGPCRMRKKMIPNKDFYWHYPYRPHPFADVATDVQRPLKYKAAVSRDSLLYFGNYRPSSLTPQAPALEAHSNNAAEDPSIQCEEDPNCLPMEKIEGQDADGSDNMTEEQKAQLSLKQTETLLRSTHSAVISGTSPEKSLGGDSLLPQNTSESEQQHQNQPNQPQQHQQLQHQQEQKQQQQQQNQAHESHAAILRLLETGEKITHLFRCARVQGLDVHEGLLLFGREHFYIIDGFTLLRTREIVDIDSLPDGSHDPIVPRNGPPQSSSTTRQQQTAASLQRQREGKPRRAHFKFAYEDIREVHERRYLLQPIALEVFNVDGRNFLLVFPKKMQPKIYAKFINLASSRTDNAQESVSGQKQSTKVEAGSGAGIINSLRGEKSVTQRWERGEISNFQYLMHLNTLAGRSYNDLMQYPVFPWILSDYDAEELDLNDPATFRDLAKPMGAQTEQRLRQFQRRYREWDDPSGETPPYHYGTHYSSAMIVASYLVRMEPFTQHFLKLQGGHFDLADRMFHSVREAWYSASMHNMADVKELIPEFFYLPDFLVNANKFELGAKQSGVELGDIVLPPWAKGDSREFIRAHREALESDFVSAHLHEWIDLIFGYKQRGEPAVDAANVFHHLFYEGNVDIYAIEDPLVRSAVIGFINNFGQIPKQLFRRPHVAKRLAISRSIPGDLLKPAVAGAERLFYYNLDSLRPSLQPIKELKLAVGQIVHTEKNGVLAVEQHKCLMPPFYSRYVAWGFSDNSLRVGNYESDRTIRTFEMIDTGGEILCSCSPGERTIVTGGKSSVVQVWKLQDATSLVGSAKRGGGGGSSSNGGPRMVLRRRLYGHTEAVVCLSASPAYNLLVSGSVDRTCIVWDLSRLCFLRQLRGHSGPVAAACINEATGDIATCAGTQLHLWSVNGDELASVNCAGAGGRNAQIYCVVMSTVMEWDERNVIMTGGSDGVVRMWSLEYVQVPDDTQTAEGADTKKGEEAASPVDGGEEEEEEDEDEDEEEDFNNSSGSLSPCEGAEIADDAAEALSPSCLPAGPVSGDELDFVIVSTDEVNSTNNPPVIKLSSAPAAASRSSPGNEDTCDRVHADSCSLGGPTSSSCPDSLPTPGRGGNAPALRPSSPFRPLQRLRAGFRWQRQLIFRSKLTMHTAFERHDNRQPAHVTSLAVSRDHRTVYVGDSRGRVFSWSVPPEPGRVIADHWMRDEGSEQCSGCSARFSLTERRHHCRNCGKIFCSKCSNFEIEIYRLRLFKPVRVCQTCYNYLKIQQQQQQQQPTAASAQNQVSSSVE